QAALHRDSARHRACARTGCGGARRLPGHRARRRSRRAPQRFGVRRPAHGDGGMNFLNAAVSFIVALGVLIVVHEYGHYLVARLCNVRVLRFSVGFGRPIFTRRFGPDATEWSIAAIPFGGYVKMLDEREGEVSAAQAHRAFNRQSVGRRCLIVAAGPAFNFLFAIAVYAGLYMHGLPEARPVLAAPPAGSLAHGAGLRAGDTVRSI